jgi:hypothetical protein
MHCVIMTRMNDDLVTGSTTEAPTDGAIGVGMVPLATLPLPLGSRRTWDGLIQGRPSNLLTTKKLLNDAGH